MKVFDHYTTPAAPAQGVQKGMHTSACLCSVGSALVSALLPGEEQGHHGHGQKACQGSPGIEADVASVTGEGIAGSDGQGEGLTIGIGAVLHQGGLQWKGITGSSRYSIKSTAMGPASGGQSPPGPPHTPRRSWPGLSAYRIAQPLQKAIGFCTGRKPPPLRNPCSPLPILPSVIDFPSLSPYNKIDKI